MARTALRGKIAQKNLTGVGYRQFSKSVLIPKPWALRIFPTGQVWLVDVGASVILAASEEMARDIRQCLHDDDGGKLSFLLRKGMLPFRFLGRRVVPA